MISRWMIADLLVHYYQHDDPGVAITVQLLRGHFLWPDIGRDDRWETLAKPEWIAMVPARLFLEPREALEVDIPEVVPQYLGRLQ